MASDPRKLKPSELCRLLNSTPFGEVTSERQIYRHRQRAGNRIGDGKTVDLLRYCAWMHKVRHAPKPVSGVDPYQRMKESARARNAALALAGRDIGELPEVENTDRKAQSARSFRYFCESYFPLTFDLGWSPDHLKVLGKIETAVSHGGLFSMAMPRGAGKALALDTPIATPFGWTTMGEIEVGDLVFDEEGWPSRVVYTSSVQCERHCYRVTFSDGEAITCDGEHLWLVYQRYARQNPKVLNTEEIRSRVNITSKRGWQERRYRVPVTLPLKCPHKQLDVDPYVLGYWLGDGTSSCSNVTVHEGDFPAFQREMEKAGESIRHFHKQGQTYACHVGYGHAGDPAMVERVKLAHAAVDCKLPLAAVMEHSGLSKGSVGGITSLDRWDSIRRGDRPSLMTRLRYIGVLGNKHIPADYLRGSIVQRLALLQGLMDSDGHINKNGNSEITLKEGLLTEHFGELLSSLGIKWGSREKWVRCNNKHCGPFVRFHFKSYRNFPCVRLQRKYDRLKDRPKTYSISSKRTIVSVEPVASVPVRCIQVDSPSRLYLAGRKMVPTHNTTICEVACIWAVLYGHRNFVCLIGSDEGHACDMLDSIKTELDSNDLLLADFPEVCYPIQSLDGISNRANGQLYKGKRTQIGWTAKEIVLPNIENSPASGAIIKVAGITGRIRGMKFKRCDGRTVRPSLVILDDPQTDESARSLSQCANRESILAGAVLGLAGPGKKISGIMPCTVIRPGDMADTILDRDKHPEWNGERTRMVYAFPSNESLWRRYAEIRAEGMRAGDGGAAATEFYRQNREAMDLDSTVAWPERFNHDELSAIQHAMNLKLQDEAAFFAEYQNEPLPEETASENELTIDQIASKINRMQRGELAISANHLTAFIDVQANLLFYLVAAWSEDFTGFVVDYGAYPDQDRPYFTLRDVRHTLATAANQTGLEGSIYAGLDRLTGELLGREWPRDDGAAMRIERCLIDANWGSSTDVVYQFCRQSQHAGVVLPSHGRFVGASSQPFSEYKRRPGDRIGHNWRIPNVHGKRAIRHVLYDTNYWKSFVHARLAVPMGDRGCLSLFGDNSERHRLLAEHLTAEYRVKTEGRGRTVDEWKMRPERADNHWLDCLVGTAVAASMQGALLFGTDGLAPSKRERVSFKSLQREKRS
jgi:hypothetical protein